MEKESLTKLGLSPEEAEIYLALLSKGPQTASQLATSTPVKRTYIYYVAQSLLAKGLIAETTHGKTTQFVPTSPDYLQSLVNKRVAEAEEAQTTLERTLTELKTKYSLVEKKPVVTYFEGEEGIKKAYLETLKEEKEILAYVRVDLAYIDPLSYFWPKYFDLRRDKNIHVRSIAPDNKEGHDYKARDKDELRETKLVDFTKYPFLIEKNIVGNKVVFFAQDEAKMIATIIENKEIADTERMIFELLWASLP